MQIAAFNTFKHLFIFCFSSSIQNKSSDKTHSLVANHHRLVTAAATASLATTTTSINLMHDLKLSPTTATSSNAGSSSSLDMNETFDHSMENLNINTHPKLLAVASIHQDQFRMHNALTRTISQPQQTRHNTLLHNHLHQQQEQQQLEQQQPQDANVTNLVKDLIELNLGSVNLHRKLERTQSEPLPQQVNTSRYVAS